MGIQSLPTPALEILDLLANESIVSSKDIEVHFSNVYERNTIKYAIRRLLKSKLIYRVPNLLDMRSVFYRIATQNEILHIKDQLSAQINIELASVFV